MVKCVLPKDESRVRFPLPAPTANVAQLVEQCFRKAEVVGSIPTIGSNKMKNYIKTNYLLLHQALFEDITDRVLFLLTIVLFATDYIIWHMFLSSPDLYVYLRIGIYPIKMLAIVLTVNTILAIASFDKEKEIGYFLFISNIILSVLVLILEIYYLVNL